MGHGRGRIFQRPYKDRHGQRQLTKTYSIEYGTGVGAAQREPARTTDPNVAQQLLTERLHALDRALPITDARSVTFEDLARLIRADYAARRRRSAKRLDQHLVHLGAPLGKDGFGRQFALSITGGRVLQYVLHRRASGAADATINRELAALKRMFRLAVEQRLLLHDHVPPIELLPEDNIRHGLILPWQMDELVALLPGQAARAAEVTYITGWRAFSDVLTRQWRPHVLWDRNVLFLETGEGKARKARKFPLFPRLRAILKAQREWTDAEEQRLGIEIPWVFHNNGARLTTYVRAWRTACRKLAEKHPDWEPEAWIRHRMRYSAVENLLAMNVAPPNICKAVGMAMATFMRYHQQSEASLARMGMALESFFGRQGAQSQGVSPFPK